MASELDNRRPWGLVASVLGIAALLIALLLGSQLSVIKRANEGNVSELVARESCDGAFRGMARLLREDLADEGGRTLVPMHSSTLVKYVEGCKHLYADGELMAYLADVARTVEQVCPSCGERLQRSMDR